jgi:hypothetical protein
MACDKEIEVRVKRVFGSKGLDDGPACSLWLKGTHSIRDVKAMICDALNTETSPKLSSDDLMLQFGPNDRKLGRQYMGDPAVDESTLLLSTYSFLGWIERFPDWGISVSFLPPTPPAPGVAVHKAAAMAENRDPDKAVTEARMKGEIPQINQLSKPWGPKPYVAPTQEQLMEQGYASAMYPEGFDPLVDVKTVG